LKRILDKASFDLSELKLLIPISTHSIFMAEEFKKCFPGKWPESLLGSKVTLCGFAYSKKSGGVKCLLTRS
jgi:hypothetical protein